MLGGNFLINKNSGLTHFDNDGRAHMVDVGPKAVSEREAKASCYVQMEAETLELIIKGEAAKGDVLGVARIAGIQGAKKCSDLIPLCHPLSLDAVQIRFSFDKISSRVLVESICKTSGRTGVEMEALCAVTLASLTIYDMCKAVDRGITVSEIGLENKSGGKSGTWTKKK